MQMGLVGRMGLLRLLSPLEEVKPLMTLTTLGMAVRAPPAFVIMPVGRT